MVCPDRLVTTSPGFTARPPGMFSQLGISATTLTLGRNSPIAHIVPSTLAAPPMSNFISSISAPGLSEMPPLSKVMPLPTSTTGPLALAPPGAPLYCRTMKRGGSSEPWATARNEPMPMRWICLRSKTSTLKPYCLPSFFACAARWLGVAWLPGRLAHSRARATPCATAWPSRNPLAKSVACALFTSKATRASLGAAGALGLVWR